MKKIISLVVLYFTLVSSTVPQFFYYNTTRKAIAIRDSSKGVVVVKNYSGYPVMTVEYPENTSRWISVTRLAPGLYTAMTTSGSSINFYKAP